MSAVVDALLLEEPVELLRLLGARELVARSPRACHRPDVAQHAPEVAAGLRVVGDVGDPVRASSAARDRRQQRVARVRRDPAVDAVGDDVVELAERAVGQLAHVALAQLDVGQPDLGDRGAALLDRLGGEVDADRADAGRRRRHRHQVAAGAAADLQHARV